MPDTYAACVDGFKIGPDSLACGLAVFLGQPILTADVTEDPRWKDWRWLAREFDYRACWSFPVETAPARVVGTFALYFREPRAATARDRELATDAKLSSEHQTVLLAELQHRVRNTMGREAHPGAAATGIARHPAPRLWQRVDRGSYSLRVGWPRQASAPRRAKVYGDMRDTLRLG